MIYLSRHYFSRDRTLRSTILLPLYMRLLDQPTWSVSICFILMGQTIICYNLLQPHLHHHTSCQRTPLRISRNASSVLYAVTSMTSMFIRFLLRSVSMGWVWVLLCIDFVITVRWSDQCVTFSVRFRQHLSNFSSLLCYVCMFNAVQCPVFGKVFQCSSAQVYVCVSGLTFDISWNLLALQLYDDPTISW